MAISVGDKVQIRAGGRDVTNGLTAKKGRMYGEGGPYWATVEKIVKGWKTGSRWGLPATVTKYRCSNKGVVVWQVQLKDLIPKTVKKEKPKAKTKKKKSKKTKTPNKKPKVTATNRSRQGKSKKENENPNKKYAPWDSFWGDWTLGDDTTKLPDTVSVNPNNPRNPPKISNSMFSKDAGLSTPKWVQAKLTFLDYYGGNGGKEVNIDFGGDNGAYDTPVKLDNRSDLQVKKKISKYTARTVYVPRVPWVAQYKTSYQNQGRKAEMLNAEYKNGHYKASARMQNGEGFPKWADGARTTSRRPTASGGLKNGKFGNPYLYDYQIIPGDPKLSNMSDLEDNLTLVRKSFGIIIPDDNDTARSAKFYLYNRFKVPDISLAHNKTTTHVFFTRPDLNIINPSFSAGGGKTMVHDQVMNHTESAMIWRRYPEIFKLLADGSRVGDSNNFNMLLSNQVSSFSLTDESLATVRHGKSWREHEIVYGQNYTGRVAGEFTCTFDETSEYSVLNMLKLWMTYIDNVATGAWSPNYYYAKNEKRAGGEFDHVTNRELDYGASVYVFKCGPDGEDILYWSKYFGVFPIVSGSSALSWERSGQIGTTPSLNITFAYSMKRDMSPISLIEFNQNARAKGEQEYIPGYSYGNAGSIQPFVGCPYIQFQLKTPKMTDSQDGVYEGQRMSIRLKFKPDEDSSGQRSDKQLYTSNSGVATFPVGGDSD